MIRFLQSGNKAAKYLLGGLLIALCLSMVIYLIPGFMSGDSSVSRSKVMATVAGHDITTEEVQRTTQMEARQRGYPDSVIPFLQQQVMNSLIQKSELMYEAGRMGLQVSDEEVADELRNGPLKEVFFPNGVWIGQQKYEQMFIERGGTAQQFEDGERFQILMAKLQAAVTSGITVAPADLEKAYKEQNVKVKFDYAVLRTEDIQKQIKPTDAEIKSFFTTNQGRYQNSIPEKRQIRYFEIKEKDLESKITLTAGEAQKYYDENSNQYKKPDKVTARHIQINLPSPGADGKVDQKAVDAARAKAQDLLKQIKGGADFAELAKKNSDDPGSRDQGGFLGEIDASTPGVDPAFKQAALAMNKGQISDPIEVGGSLHIIKIDDKVLGKVTAFSEARGEIETKLKQAKLHPLLVKTAQEAQKDARDGFDKAAAKYGAPVVETPPISRSDSLPGLGNSPELMNVVFSVAEKTGAEIARSPQGAIVFQVEKIVPPRTPSLDEIKDKVTADFKAERAGTLIAQKAKDLSERAHTQHDLAKAAKELGATFKSSELVGRSDTVPDVGAMAGPASAAFNLKQGEISQPISAGPTTVVLMLTARQDPSMGEDFAKAKDGIQERLVEQKRQEALQLFMSNLDERLKKEGKVKVKEKQAGLPMSGRS